MTALTIGYLVIAAVGAVLAIAVWRRERSAR